jgi:spore coat assembly protein
MEEIGKNDLVSRKSHKKDILFRVLRIIDKPDTQPHGAYCILKGCNARLIADAPLQDLEKACTHDLELCRNKMRHETQEIIQKVHKNHISEEKALRNQKRLPNKDFLKITGKILHIDGDEYYLQDCLDYYHKLGLNAVGEHIQEERQPLMISRLLNQHTPDILVLTGHDGFNKKSTDTADLEAYRTSGHFVKAVKAARRFEPDKDSLVIFAGACQSFYEAILQAGANFASSPKRVFIHCYDPVFIAARIANTPFNSIVSIEEILSNTMTGMDGIGGIETHGKMRLSLPKLD